MKHAATVIAIILFACSNAQWTVVNLHPEGALSSAAFGVHGSHQVGVAVVPDPFWGQARHASLWSGTSQSWVDLEPFGDGGPEQSTAYGVHGGNQIGITESIGGGARATIWAGSSGSFEELLAPDWPTYAYSIYENQKVGSWHSNGEYLACMWTGISNQFVDLHPVVTVRSEALAVGGGQQVGYAFVGIAPHASLWTGTATSWVDLHPTGGSISASSASSVDAGQQAGFVVVDDFPHASLWNGTAASWVDLNPAGASSSGAHGVHGGQQVGSAMVGASPRASLWSGTAGSWVDLHAFLPPEFTSSDAFGISQDGGVSYVVGTGNNSATNRDEALMWVSRVVAPASYTPVRGIVTGGNLSSLLTSDNNRLMVRPGIVFATGEPPVQIRVDARAPAAFPNGIAFSVESSATFGNAQQRIWLWNYVIGDYELVDTRLATLTDDVTNVIVRTNASRFIQPGTLAIRALISYRAIGPAFAYPWSARIDKVWWTFPG